MVQTTTRSETIAFTRGVPAPELLPDAQLAECFAAVLEADPVGTLQYGQQPGYGPLRRLLAERYRVGEDAVFVTNGSLQLMDLLAAHLIKPGDSVLVEQPSYDRAIGVYRKRGARVIGIPLEHDGLDVGRLETQLRRQVPAFLYLIPDFQNPSGLTLSLEKRRRVLELAERHHFRIVEDVPYRLLRYRGGLLPMLRELDHPAARRVITLSSYSKLVAPGLRVGHVIALPEIVAGLSRLAEDTYLTPVLPTQAALAEFIRRGWLEPNIERLKQAYAPRWRAMVDAVRTHLPQVTFAEPEGGFFLSVTLPPGANATGLVERARGKGLLLSDGRGFFADSDDGTPPPGERFIRLPFCAVTPEQIEEGMRRLGSVLAQA
jgi:DNA-binding transcriptional MocR family regulator